MKHIFDFLRKHFPAKFFSFFSTIKGKGKGRLGLIKIDRRCWRRRMVKVVNWSKEDRAAHCARAQLERAMAPYPFCPRLEPLHLSMWKRTGYSNSCKKGKIIPKPQGGKRSTLKWRQLFSITHLTVSRILFYNYTMQLLGDWGGILSVI